VRGSGMSFSLKMGCRTDPCLDYALAAFGARP